MENVRYKASHVRTSIFRFRYFNLWENMSVDCLDSDVVFEGNPGKLSRIPNYKCKIQRCAFEIYIMINFVILHSNYEKLLRFQIFDVGDCSWLLSEETNNFHYIGRNSNICYIDIILVIVKLFDIQ